MKNNIFTFCRVFITFVFVIVTAFGGVAVQKALAQQSAGCWANADQKTSEGNGPNSADASGTAPAYHCNSTVSISSAYQSGNTFYVTGTILGGGITSFCTPYGSTDQDTFISEQDYIYPGFLFDGDQSFDYTNVPAGAYGVTAYDGKGNLVPLDELSVLTAGYVGHDCGTGPIDQDAYNGGDQYFATFSYHFDISSYTNQQPFTTYIGIASTANGYYENQYDNPNSQVTYDQNTEDNSVNLINSTLQNCKQNGWTSTPACRDYWSYYHFTPTITQTTGAINVAADRSTNWNVSGASGALYAGSGTSASYNSAPADTYRLVDQSNAVPYGFQDNPTFAMVGKPSLFAQIIHSAEASSCTGWRCVLSGGGSISYNMQSTFCRISIVSTLDKQNTSGMAFNITEGYDPIHGSPPDPSASNSPNTASGNTTTGTTVVNSLLTDPNIQQSYKINAPLTITTSGGGTADLDISTMVNATYCDPVNASNNQSSKPTLTLPYVTRAGLKIQ